MALLMACSGSDSTGPETRRGIQFVAGAGSTDTTSANLVQALVVEVHDSSGAVVPEGTVVRFTSVVTNFVAEALVGSLTGSANSTFITSPTDAAGRAAVIVRLGGRAGPARIAVGVPTFGLLDTARYTVLPGNAARIVLVPDDTLLFAPATYTVQGTVTDANGNPRSDPLSWTTSGPGVSVSNTGVVTASAVGSYTVTATAGTASATSAVSIVPPLQLTAWELEGNTSQIVTMNIDGTNRRILAQVSDGGIGAHPSWIVGGTRAIYTTMVGSQQTLRTADESGSALFMPTPPSVMSHQAEPIPSANGNWMFFSAFDTNCGSSDYCLYRSTINGSNPQLLAAGFPARQPAPSPDGTKVAFTRSDFGSQIRVLDIASGVVSSWSVSGQRPRWSPLGDRIAFVPQFGGRIMTMNPDGTSVTALTPAGRTYALEPINWSPDGQWLIARSTAGVLDLIHAGTGNAVPLPHSAALHAASLK
jgi:hypothetical protein